GSLSPASSVTHAIAVPLLAHHVRTAVVFPYPAGAATNVRAASAPSSSARITFGRCTIPVRSRGGASLASASGGSSSAGRRSEDKPPALRSMRRLAIVSPAPVHRKLPGHAEPADNWPDR